MTPESLAFLKSLLDTPGPSAFEAAPARVWRAEAAEVRRTGSHADVSGNSLATLNADSRPRVMLAGHIDEIGVMVTTSMTKATSASIRLAAGTTKSSWASGSACSAATGRWLGVVGKKAIHIMDKDDREKVSKVQDLWIDIGAIGPGGGRAAASGSATRACSQRRVWNFPMAGSSAGPSTTASERSWCSRRIRLLAADGTRPAPGVTAVATTREEIAATGGGARSSATMLEPDVAIVIDVTHATDYPGIDKRRHGDYRLGGGPVLSRGASVSELVFERLAAAAEAEGIPYAIEAASRDTHTDAEAIFNAHRGVATALVSVPNRYMHSPNEMIALEDLDRTARLFAAFVRRLAHDTDFVPR